MKYTIERLTLETLYNSDVLKYLNEEAPKISKLFDNKLNYKNCPVHELVINYIFLICRREGEITGHMILELSESPLDNDVKILYQISFYAKPHSGRTAFHLFQKFIDIGQKESNHIITMLTSKTNIKSSTLERMGFKELETLYRLEVPKK